MNIQILVALFFLFAWIASVLAVALSRRADGIEKALYVLISLMFPLIGWLAFLLAKSTPRTTLRDLATGK